MRTHPIEKSQCGAGLKANGLGRAQFLRELDKIQEELRTLRVVVDAGDKEQVEDPAGETDPS